ncbi:trimeric intracellular cation channel family protein [Antrihabitans sp. YC2-6]|uniref:trimeric intracellular cation channel family protein n=1 Tax=Antrihabitans sp. YC2-6 TaxID=2799498 RepID=UPI0018F6940F|nr:TRIC cation channel family protein [Antrihabitans sp. YC2-6]MBJ8344728.1 TRIC cation channel family protein [Antrihabitans sp. YC2-6]
MLLQILNLIGVAAFAASGALVGVQKQLDVFGVVVVGATTGIGGGIIRDLLLGIHPPTSLADWPNITVSLCVSLVVFVAHAFVSRLWNAVVLLDALGMGLFTTGGASIALNHGAGALAAVLVGATGAVGGGVLRDMIVNEVPLLLSRDLYAVPALLGALVVVVGDGLGVAASVALIGGTVLATGLRLIALWQKWHLPQAR